MCRATKVAVKAAARAVARAVKVDVMANVAHVRAASVARAKTTSDVMVSAHPVKRMLLKTQQAMMA